MKIFLKTAIKSETLKISRESVELKMLSSAAKKDRQDSCAAIAEREKKVGEIKQE